MGRKKSDAGKNKRPRKLFVEFDPEARREFVTGMHRRKQQRKEKAISDLKKQVEKERKEARDERRAILLERRDKSTELRKKRREAKEEEDEEERNRDNDDNDETESGKKVVKDVLDGSTQDDDDDDGDDDDDDSDEEEEQEQGAKDMDMVSKLTGQKAVVQEEQVEDEFSKDMFGSGTVTVTTTTLGDDDEEDEETLDPKAYAAAKAAKQPVALLGEKNAEYTPGKAERMLQRLQHKKNRRAHARALVGGSKNSKAKVSDILRTKKGKKSKKGRKTTAKERRRRT